MGPSILSSIIRHQLYISQIYLTVNQQQLSNIFLSWRFCSSDICATEKVGPVYTLIFFLQDLFDIVRQQYSNIFLLAICRRYTSNLCRNSYLNTDINTRKKKEHRYKHNSEIKKRQLLTLKTNYCASKEWCIIHLLEIPYGESKKQHQCWQTWCGNFQQEQQWKLILGAEPHHGLHYSRFVVDLGCLTTSLQQIR